MSIDMANFSFSVEELELDERNDVIARIPPSLCGSSLLFDALERSLHFPEWGKNWDALNDWLGSLWWITQRRVVLMHHDLPSLEHSELTIYLDILSDCVRNWKPGGVHEFIVVFPKDSYNAILKVSLQQGRH